MPGFPSVIWVEVVARATSAFWYSVGDTKWDSICQPPGADDSGQGSSVIVHRREERPQVKIGDVRC